MNLRNSKNYPKSLESKSTYIRITAPENLDVALEGLVRKVLKEQPKADDIYTFAADYFEALLEIRDKAGEWETGKLFARDLILFFRPLVTRLFLESIARLLVPVFGLEQIL